MRGNTVRRHTGLRVGLLGALALLSAVALPASAVATAPTAAGEQTHLVLTRVSGIDQNHTTRHRLTCSPVGGDHPRAASACDQITAVQGDLSRLGPYEGPCTLEYGPQHVTIEGTYRGAWIYWEHEYVNPCLLLATTGDIFRF
ncbi:hypothetical protein D5S17_09005 [Pseudonocardiaceae bacterium YIM PH 21723]|nr:hypothetical protein D5S17_09005 [Pseudonocardiaceae bacterium YIM PH 21723]